MNADCKWVARIQNTNLKLFDKRLRQDLPGEYGTHIGREILLWDRYEFDADQINYHWSAHERKEHKQLAVVLTATHYREDMLTIQIGRYVPVNVLLSPQTAKFGTQEWNEMRKNQSERRVVFTSGNEGLTITNIPWSERDEIVSVHGRRLVKWLLGWFEECFGVKPVCDISDEVVNEIEAQELTGEYRLTEDGKSELRECQVESSDTSASNKHKQPETTHENKEGRLAKPINKPEKGMGRKHQARWSAWFKYYHDMNRRGYNYTLEWGLWNDLDKTFSQEYLKQVHLEYCQDEVCISERS